VIFHDRTLSEIARLKPALVGQLAEIGGIGQNKLDRYGQTVLELVSAARP
jgi:ATP-dependent DNA helicase RecQ